MTPKGMLAATVGFTVCLACSSPGASGGAGGSRAGNGGTSASGGSGGLAGSSGARGSVACNDIVLSAPVVSATYDPNPAPQPLGGTIADGTYFMTAVIVYDTASSPTDADGRSQVVISGTTWQQADESVSIPYSEEHVTNTLYVDGTTILLLHGCGYPQEPGSESLQFSADTTGFTLYDPVHMSMVTVYTKQ